MAAFFYLRSSESNDFGDLFLCFTLDNACARLNLCNRFWLARSYHEQAFFDLFTYFIYKFPFSADYFLTLHNI